MRRVSKLAFLNWEAIKESAKKKTLQCSDAITICKEKSKAYRSQLNRKSQEKDFFVVSLSLTSILHFEVKSSKPGNVKNQIFRMKKYLQELQVPDMTGEWSLTGFVAMPDVYLEDIDPHGTKFQNCLQCAKHMLYKNDIEKGGFYDKIKDLSRQECVIAEQKCSVEDSPKFKRKTCNKNALRAQEVQIEGLRIADKARQERNYIQLISNIVILSNMEVTPHSQAVAKVMPKLSGTKKRVVGTGKLTAINHLGLCTY